LDRIPDLKPNDFYCEPHRNLFALMLKLHQRNEPIDPQTMRSAGADGEAIKIITESAYLVPHAENIVPYARRLRSQTLLRAIASTASEIAAAAYDTQLDTAGFAAEVEARMLAVTRIQLDNPLVPFAEVIDNVLRKLRAGELAGLPSGIKSLDEFLTGGGFVRGDLITMAAATSVGKTAIGCNIITHHPRGGVLLFSAEMSDEDIARRMVAERSEVDLGAISRRPRAIPTDDEWIDVRKAGETLKQYPLEVYHKSRLTPADIRRETRLCLQQFDGKLDLIVVDYAQLMQSNQPERRRDLEIGAITSELKSLAIEFKAPVILLSQVNRAAMQTTKHEGIETYEPQLYNLRESGSLEQDSDVVIMLWEPTEAERKLSLRLDEREVHWKIAKQRNGIQTMLEPLKFIPKYTRFVG
jgi:replicative DNA helicase